MKIDGEHNTNSEWCWCHPKIDVMENGNKVIIHNDITPKEATSDKIAEAEMASKKAGYEIKRLNKYIDELIKNGNALSFQGMDICGVDSANGTRREKFRVSSWRWEQIVSERDTHGKPVLDE